jgi:hypothetical protein
VGDAAVGSGRLEPWRCFSAGAHTGLICAVPLYFIFIGVFILTRPYFYNTIGYYISKEVFMHILYVFIDAIIISAVFYGGIFLMIKINPRLQLHNYPPQIRNSVPPKTKKERKLFVLIAVPIIFVLIFYVIISFFGRFNNSINYFAILFYYLSVWIIVSLVDLFVCDYLIFCTITPKFIIIPGTEGSKFYKDKSFHTKTMPMMLIITVILSFVTSLLYFFIE